MKRNNVLRNTQGFTLVELAIVLVIIGLIIGGVLKGRELITSAKVKSVGEQMKAVSAAVETYKDKFPKSAAFPNMSSMQSSGLLTGSNGMKNRFAGDVFTVSAVTVNGKSYSAVVSTNVPGTIAKMVDDLNDDGIASSGSIIVVDNAATPVTPAPNNAAAITAALLAPLTPATFDNTANTAMFYLF